MNINDMIETPAALAVTALIDATTAVAMRDDIIRVEAGLAEFDKISAGLSDLAARFPSDLAYDVATTKGMADAVAHRAAWREPRVNVEKLRKSAKAPVLALGRNIDARAAWLTERLIEGERPVDEQIKSEEQRKEAIKQAKIEAEFGRVQAIQDAIASIHIDATISSTKASSNVRASLDALRTQVLDPLVFQEMMAQAEAARSAAVSKLQISLDAALHREAEASRIDAERTELEQLRQQAAAQKAKDDAARSEAARLEAEAAAIVRAENARISANLAEQQARINAEADDLRKQAADLASAQEVVRLERAETERLQRIAEDARVAASTQALLPADPPPEKADDYDAPSAAELATTATLTVGQINERIAPFAITTAALESMGLVRQTRPGPGAHFLAADMAVIQNLGRIVFGVAA